ncbi:Protein of unknown function [Pyronema omphalodes CBS 100304]|uniref:Uncharacterized protein n=1 Tax=Pyronema omphalodes (strain CBS 100304) TaxID=1076935 RepID=U4L783_PYROM|nr:Protein of unknown function [Pyronema omphalodes CBS 100304]
MSIAVESVFTTWLWDTTNWEITRRLGDIMIS